MTVENQTASMYSGDDQVIRIECTDSDGSALDLSGGELEFAIGTVVTKTTSGGSITVSGTDNDIAEVQLDASDTANLEGGYPIELELTDAAENVSTLMRGWLRIKADLIEEA